ncbi:MAG TPA: xanthine dehydrogenase family protein subunit M [Gaiellaceae bacterium]|jgi:carbon-monoxide dehydrogenase medium subunit
MTLPPFDLHRTRTPDEARELLERYGEDAAVVCGGTELLLLLKLGFAAYGHLVDIKGIDDLRGIRAENGSLVIGATATHREIERSPAVRERLPALAAMARNVANPRVRNVGTLGGNLCFSDPHSDPATFLLALDAEVDHDGGRTPIGDFLVGPYETALRHGQLLRAVRIPLPEAGTGVVHRKLSFHERPAATVTVAIRTERGRIVDARVAVGSVGPRAIRATSATETLIGKEAADVEAIAEAEALAAEQAEAVEDANGSIEYKQQLVRVLVERCLTSALDIAEGTG